MNESTLPKALLQTSTGTIFREIAFLRRYGLTGQVGQSLERSPNVYGSDRTPMVLLFAGMAVMLLESLCIGLEKRFQQIGE